MFENRFFGFLKIFGVEARRACCRTASSYNSMLLASDNGNAAPFRANSSKASGLAFFPLSMRLCSSKYTSIFLSSTNTSTGSFLENNSLFQLKMTDNRKCFSAYRLEIGISMERKVIGLRLDCSRKIDALDQSLGNLCSPTAPASMSTSHALPT